MRISSATHSTAGKYQDVIVPLTVLRRIDQVLEPMKEEVLETHGKYRDKLDNPDELLMMGAVVGHNPSGCPGGFPPQVSLVH